MARSLIAHEINCKAAVAHSFFVGDNAVFSAGGAWIFLAPDGTSRWFDTHEGVLLCAALAPHGLLSGGDDGRVVMTAFDGSHRLLAQEKSWIDHVAAHAQGACAWTQGKTVYLSQPATKLRSLNLDSSAGGLCFFGKGIRLASAHYNGVTLWRGLENEKPAVLTWKGSHTGVTASGDGRYIVTTMQENALHGWRLDDGAHMRMTGYPTKPKSLSWSAKGKWLASSGADAAIVWPFAGKDGPMGKSPLELGVRSSPVTAVAFHPSEEVLAIGFKDGMVMLVRLDDGAEVLARAADNTRITTLTWDQKGLRLACATDAGTACVLKIT